MYPFTEQEMNIWLKENEQPFIRDLKRLVRIPSVISEATPGLPFGKNIQLALEEILHISKELGFRTFIDPDGYYGIAELGSGEEMIGVLGHIDVVPPGDEEEWELPPFDPQLLDGKLYGRGTQDDKGPTLAALYAAKLLTDFHFTGNKRIRFIFGTDEETLWRCMKEYSKKEEMPGQGFTPDSSFPLVFAEKGLLQFTLTGLNESGIRIKAGTAFNAVPDAAEYFGDRLQEISQQLERLGYPFKTTQNGIRVTGESVHAQIAEQGKNAIVRLALALHEAGVTSKAIKFISEVIKEDANATAIFGNCEDEVSGKLKFNIGKIELDEQKESLSIDMRIPVTADKEELVGKVIYHVEQYGLTYEEFDYLRSIYVPLDDPLVKTLLDVYQEVTGDFTSKPISSGGATYARTMDHCVAFGAVLPGKKKVEHQPNEHIVLSDIQQAIRIYAKALYRLAK